MCEHIQALKVVDVKQPEEEECEQEEPQTIAVYGASGETGQTAIDYLIQLNHKVIVVTKPGSGWTQVKEVSVREIPNLEDKEAFAAAFEGIDGAIVLPSMPYKSPTFFAEFNRSLSALRWGLEKADVPKLVVMSSFGAHLNPSEVELGYISCSHYVEHEFSNFPNPVTFLRPAWLIDNYKAMAKAVLRQGIFPSLIGPMDRKREMVTSFDLGVWGVKLLLEQWRGNRAVELQGPEMISPQDIADTIQKTLGVKDFPITAMPVNPTRYPDVLKSFLGPNALEEWIKTLASINKGLIKFEGGASKTVLGETTMEEYVKTWFTEDDIKLAQKVFADLAKLKEQATAVPKSVPPTN